MILSIYNVGVKRCLTNFTEVIIHDFTLYEKNHL